MSEDIDNLPAVIDHPDPPEEAEPPVRVVALTASGAPLPIAFARLVEALRDAGHVVTPVPVPRKRPPEDRDAPPRLSDLKAGLQALADNVVATLRGDERSSQEQDHWLVSTLRAVEGRVDAVVALDPHVGAQVFPVIDRVWPKAVRIAVDADYHLDPEWGRAPFDDLIVAHAGLGADVARVRDGLARVRTGGPVVGGEQAGERRLDEDKPQVAVSFARMGAGDVDPLLFQLSLARPERLSLLFLPSGRTGIDELVRTRAGGYGLRGKRPKSGADMEKWVRGAAVLVGMPTPGESAAAVVAGVPQLLFSTDKLSPGDKYLADHGAAEHSSVPLTIAVQLESLLPGGDKRDEVVERLGALTSGGATGAAVAIADAARAERPSPTELRSSPASPAAQTDDELEDIGGPGVASTSPAHMPNELRKAYLSEIILRQKDIERQLSRARAGLDTWRNRAKLALTAGNKELAREAAQRVEGLQRIVDRLGNQAAELQGLRDRFAGREPLTEADSQAASRFMSPGVAETLDRASKADPAEFTRLELNDALQRLKDRLKGS